MKKILDTIFSDNGEFVVRFLFAVVCMGFLTANLFGQMTETDKEITKQEQRDKRVVSNLVGQMPQPTMVDELKVPTMSISNFVNQAEIEGLEDSRVFLGVRQILTENVMDSRYDLVEGNSDFEMKARVVYLGRPRTSATILGLFKRESTTTEIRVVVELINKKTGKVVSGNGVGFTKRDISATGLQINEDLPFDRSELGGALKE